MTGSFNVIRSSNQNLEALATVFDTHHPGTFFQPRITTYRRTRTSRNLRPHQVLMYPGYAFVDPGISEELKVMGKRWSFHYLKTPITNQIMTIPSQQLEYAMEVQSC